MLRVEQLVAGYTRTPVLHSVSLAAAPNSVVAIVGPNGCGKSTLLKAILGLVKPSGGHVYLDDVEVTGWPAHRVARAGIAYVPQLANVFMSLTVRENLEMGGYKYSGDLKQRIDEILAMFPELASYGNRQAHQLSVGQRNTVAAARALVLNPRVILLDEPTAGLSPSSAAGMMDRLAHLAASGVAVVIVEQNVEIALQYSQRCYVLLAGRNSMEANSNDIDVNIILSQFLGRDSFEEETLADFPKVRNQSSQEQEANSA